MPDITLTISDEEQKALSTVMKSPEEWLYNTIRVRARKAINEICKDVLNEGRDHSISKKNLATVAAMLAERGDVITDVKRLPDNIARNIVKLAKITTAKEREERILSEVIG